MALKRGNLVYFSATIHTEYTHTYHTAAHYTQASNWRAWEVSNRHNRHCLSKRSSVIAITGSCEQAIHWVSRNLNNLLEQSNRENSKLLPQWQDCLSVFLSLPLIRIRRRLGGQSRWFFAAIHRRIRKTIAFSLQTVESTAPLASHRNWLSDKPNYGG